MLLERVGRELELLGDRVEHLLGWLAQSALDLRQIRIRDPGELGELPHAHGLQLTLTANERAERGFCSPGISIECIVSGQRLSTVQALTPGAP